ncbi:hypothetical protein HN800_01825 [bacterium]|nr:hypothetical protein [bacterium]MBT6067845.1 hypothetical protein [bacterium]MBT6335490.1 hypothetical protein [bacterium]MBT7336484.1 hypothetical protein [bacterium]
MPKLGSLDVDTGNHRYDHHNKKDKNKCAMNLVAEDCGMFAKFKNVIQRICVNDIGAGDILGGQANGFQDISIRHIVDGHRQLDQDASHETQVQSFWNMLTMVRAVLEASLHLDGFKRNGGWKKILKKAYGKYLWLKYYDELKLVGSHPETLEKTINQLNVAFLEITDGEYSLEDAEKDMNLFKFFNEDSKWFINKDSKKWQPQIALFSICGVAYGLTKIFNKCEVNDYLVEYLNKLDSLSIAWHTAIRDLSKPEKSRIIKVSNRYNNLRFPSVATFVKSGSIKINPASRYTNGGSIKLKASFTIMFRENNQIQIMGNNFPDIERIINLIGISLRDAESICRGIQYEPKKIDKHGEYACWFKTGTTPDQAHIVANRTLTNPSVEITSLTPATIMKIVVGVIEHGSMPSSKTIRDVLNECQYINGFVKDRGYFRDFRHALLKEQGGWK